MNQIEFVKALKSTTHNAVDTAYNFTSKAFMLNMNIDKVDLIIISVLAIVSCYFAKKFVNRAKINNINRIKLWILII